MIATVRKKLRGKYNPTCKKKKYPNLQWVRLEDGKRVKSCTRCIRTINKVRIKTSHQKGAGQEKPQKIKEPAKTIKKSPKKK